MRVTCDQSSNRLPEALGQHLGFRLAKANQELQVRVETATSQFEITPRHFGLLLLLSEDGAMHQTAIAQGLRLDRTTVTYLVDDLEARGWVERGRDPNDRRAHAVHVTPSGETLLAELRPRAQTAEVEFLAPLSTQECDQLKALLARLI